MAQMEYSAGLRRGDSLQQSSRCSVSTGSVRSVSTSQRNCTVPRALPRLSENWGPSNRSRRNAVVSISRIVPMNRRLRCFSRSMAETARTRHRVLSSSSAIRKETSIVWFM